MTREHAPKAGVTWDTRPIANEIVVPDTRDGIDHNAPLAPRPNRATRRALARAARTR
ncbi:hypothetical protein [Kitasatospora camelliae]|uniref:Uncharacterized protein n=1 Tax=Kitasatospora camelliae TaxID=3156397 RepID=A0AAU8K2Q6_9ACTN